MPVFFHKVKSFFTKTSSRTTIKPLRRKLLFYGGLVFILTLIELLLYSCSRSDSDSQKLEALTGQIAFYELYGNSINLHYTLTDYSLLDKNKQSLLEEASVSLPVFYDGFLEKEQNTYHTFLQSLLELDMDHLSAHEQYLYLILLDSLQDTCESLSYPYYSEPLSPSSGEQTSLLILLAEYRLESKDDIEDYLELLTCIPDYFNGLLLYEQNKADAGLFMSDAAADKVISQCDSLCTVDSLNRHTHFLQTTFQARLEPLIASSVITQEEADAYIARNEDLLLNTVSPAYTTLADGIFLLKGSGHNPNGLCYYEDGISYYENLLSQTTGSDRTPEEILLLLKETFSADYTHLCEVATEMNALSMDLTVSFPELPFQSPEEMLADLKIRIQSDFPALPDGISCNISAVDKALSPYTSPAFYLTPPIDAYENNQIYINYGDRPDSLTLYTTLAHEGYPGHLLQTVFHAASLNSESLLPLEGMLSYGGYVEGWATYVEDISYEYVADILAESCGYSEREATLLTEFYRLDRRLQLCLYSMLDISIHYYGMTKPEATSLLNAYGITDPDTITWIYEYIVEEPACYLKYYLGFLEICSLKETAKTTWGNDYSDLRFHTFLLDYGPAPFSLLQETLVEYH